MEDINEIYNLKRIIKNQENIIYQKNEELKKLKIQVENWREATARVKRKLKEDSDAVNIRVSIDSGGDKIRYILKTKFNVCVDHKLVKYKYSTISNNKELLIKEHPELNGLFIDLSSVYVNKIFTRNNNWFVEIVEQEKSKTWVQNDEGYVYCNLNSPIGYDYMRKDLVYIKENIDDLLS
ncbi:MAG: hypothetical protein ACRC7N_04340 [Clostridium sp.]